MTHKLATWIDQFGTSGCVGCGRCITWCPVAIDITEEAAAIRATDLGPAARGRRGIRCRRLTQLLAEAPAFNGLSAEHLELIAGCAHERGRSRPASYLFREGDPADTLLRDPPRPGRARDLRPAARARVTIETLDDGDLLGWSWLFPPYRVHFDARALGHGARVAFDGACLRGKCDDDPELGYELMRRFIPVIVERLQATRLRLLDVYGHVGGGLSAAPPAGRCCPAPVPSWPATRQETADTWTLELEPAGRRRRRRFAPGPVHDALRLRRRRGADLGQRRPGGRRPLVHTVRAVGAATRRDLRGRAGRPARRPRPVRERLAAGGGRGRRRRRRRRRHRPRAAAPGDRARCSPTATRYRAVVAALRRAARPTSCSTRASSSAGARRGLERRDDRRQRRRRLGRARSASSPR